MHLVNILCLHYCFYKGMSLISSEFHIFKFSIVINFLHVQSSQLSLRIQEEE
jgi:hypothetical protein